MAIQDFTFQQELTSAQMDTLQANDYNWTVSTKTGSYTLVAADKGTRIAMNSASATTITVNTSLFNAGDTLFIQNIGAGTCTITAGTATVTTAGSLALAQWGGGTLYFTSASAAIFFPSGGIGYGAATGGTGVTSATVGGVNYNYTSFTSTGTLTVTKAGLFDVLVFGSGAGGVYNFAYGGGGASGGISKQTIYLSANQTVTIGAGGASDANGNPSSIGSIPDAVAASGGQYFLTQTAGNLGGQTGGSNGTNSGATNVQGYVGGTSQANQAGGGGGGTAGAGQPNSGGTGGAGGVGFDVSAFIGGSSLFKGAGGGGGGTTGGAGGSGIGGTGGSGSGQPGNAAANTASGGGSRGSGVPSSAGTGGSGIIYIRWKV
jgi:hypothetical protein